MFWPARTPRTNTLKPSSTNHFTAPSKAGAEAVRLLIVYCSSLTEWSEAHQAMRPLIARRYGCFVRTAAADVSGAAATAAAPAAPAAPATAAGAAPAGAPTRLNFTNRLAPCSAKVPETRSSPATYVPLKFDREGRALRLELEADRGGGHLQAGDGSRALQGVLERPGPGAVLLVEDQVDFGLLAVRRVDLAGPAARSRGRGGRGTCRQRREHQHGGPQGAEEPGTGSPRHRQSPHGLAPAKGFRGGSGNIQFGQFLVQSPFPQAVPEFLPGVENRLALVRAPWVYLGVRRRDRDLADRFSMRVSTTGLGWPRRGEIEVGSKASGE